MRLNAVKMLGISITNSSKKEILEEIQKYLFYIRNSTSEIRHPEKKPLIIVTPNTEQLVYAQKNQHFANVLNQADIALPDSHGIVWASKFLSYQRITNDELPITKTIPGIDFMDVLVQMAASRHVPIGLIGGRGKVAIKTLECLQKKYPALEGWAQEETDIHQKAGMIFVALGAPKQEFFINEAAQKAKGVIFMAVGGSFDIISGRLPRAPLFMRTIGLEWLWRLMLEPWRIVRQLALAEFIWLVIRERLSGRSK